MFTLNTKIERLPGIGPSLKKTLNRLGLFYIEDLFFHLPFRYIDFSKKIPIGKAEQGQMVTLEGQIRNIQARRSFRSRLQFTEAILEDSTGDIHLMWFNQPYLAKQFAEGDQIIVAGKVEWYNRNQLTNPYWEKISNTDNEAHGKILPIYHLTKGITNLRLAKLIKISWDNTKKEFTELLSVPLLNRFELSSLSESVQNLHYPTDQNQINAGRFRIAVDDCLPQQVASTIKQRALKGTRAPKLSNDVEAIKNAVSKLPFELTDSQKRATWDILQDMSKGSPMNRLLEGDVGSGKTVVAWLASYMAALDDYQTIILAPTEILASQHFDTFINLAGPMSSQIGLLTRNFCKINSEDVPRDEMLKRLATNELKIVIGTHALLSEHIDVGKLGLIVIDEQHRFGVAQRAFLQKTHGNKSGDNEEIPHLLSMSATPIPRTLALSLFGNLDISQLNQMPKNRQKITTQLFSESNRAVAYAKIRKEIESGRQAFIITPKVEESDTKTKSVKAEFERLTKLFPEYKLGLVYGALNGEEKDKVMNSFANKEINILVATTVIEIGIDMPNATVMLIEGAENFGLAQLHQLRGRVGRGSHPSYCYLFTTTEEHMETKRLKIFEQISDGFALAEYDLKERGFGDLFGQQQSGFNFRFPEFVTIAALQKAHEIATELLDSDPTLADYPKLKELSSPYLQTIHTE
ncbi:ATP-dependent DNA helicase RecG [bacterium]|nr:MAG: ATP-dependent DNA helicase RecG [bacterium]